MIYIGKHKTKNPNDDYMGSSRRLKEDIDRYGIENFKKEILFDYDNYKAMNDKERELVNEDFVIPTGWKLGRKFYSTRGE